MEREEIKCEIEEAEEENEALQVRQSTKLPNNLNLNCAEDDDELQLHSDFNQEKVDINFVADDNLVSAPIEELNLNFNGEIDDLEAESKEQVDSNSSEKCVSYQNAKGTGSSNGLFSNGHSSIEHAAPEKINRDSEVDATRKSLNTRQCLSQESELEHEKQHGSLSGSSPLPSEISPEEDKTSLNSSGNKSIQSSDTNLLYASNHEASELDVEGVLRKQDTHDLYCPNCNSCITKRVIIRKRKRRLPNLGEEGKRNKLETVAGPCPISTSVPTPSNTSQDTVDTCVDGSGAPASNNIDQDQEPDVFRCLSCFSIFIPTGDGFKLFRMFGDRSDKDNLQDPPQPQVLKKSWFSTLFQSDTRVGASADAEIIGTEVFIPSNSTSQQNGSVSPIHESFSHTQTNLSQKPIKSNFKEVMEHGTNKSFPQKVSLAEPENLDNLRDQVSMNLNEENGESSENKTPSDAIYADGKSVQSEISGSKEGGINVPSPSYYEVLRGHESKHPGITLAGIPPTTSREAAEISTFKPQESGLKFFIPSAVSSNTVETSQTDQKINGTIPSINSDEKETAILLRTPLLLHEESPTISKVNITSSTPLQNEQKSSALLLSKFATQTGNEEVTTNDEADKVHSEGYQHNNIYKAEAYRDEPLKADQSTPIPVIQNTLLLKGRQIDLKNPLKDTDAPKSSVSDTIVIESSQTEEPDAQVQNLTNAAEIGNLQQLEARIQINEQRGISTEGIQGLDIIKSIVYGGLVESITSLGVVSSAAGSDSPTLNVLALGLGALIGGLIVIGHNIWELKYDKKTEASDQLDEEVDRYHEQLGHRRNFLLHAVVAIISFLVFGLVPPVTYGFSFRKSDDRNLKLVNVAAASLLSIIILASGKAYVKRPPRSYIKTVLYYVIMGLMVSGISYGVGNLINMFLENLHIFQSGSVVTLPENVLMKPAWASY
ncbi:hypothetical protein AgCh_036854 [Apium graveolens]